MKAGSKIGRRARPEAWTLALALWLGACSDESTGFGAPRDVEGAAARVPCDASTKDRFALGAAPGAKPAEEDAPSGRVAWDVPEGWSELPVSSMRVANFRVAGDEHAECYLTLLGGEAGGLASNINRWRTQLSAPPLTPAEIEALPKAVLMGQPAVLVDFTGTWRGMTGSESSAGWRLTGLVSVDPQGSAFLKMTGPDALIAGEKEHLLALGRSLRVETHDHASGEPDPHAGLDLEALKGSVGPSKPASEAPGSPAIAMGSAEGLSWSAPAGWKQGPAKSMRVVTFVPAAGVECYISVLDGDGGGMLANLNRWRKQLGCADLAAAEFEALAHLDMLGTDARLIEIEGVGEGAGKGLLGAVALSGGRSVYVKLTGPIAAVRAERDNLRAFAGSLKETR